MRLAALVASRNRPDLVDSLVDNLRASLPAGLDWDLYVAECGSDSDKMSRHSNLWFADPDFRGKCFGHNVALQAARLAHPYDYYLVLMNDVVFDPAQRPVQRLLETMEANPEMAVLSPTEPGERYPGGSPQKGGGWRKITTSDYLALMMRGRAVEEVGFLHPSFRYCWGAIHELSFRMYRKGWFLAYSDEVTFQHLGGSTYGQPGTATISREEYQRRAKRAAFDHMWEYWGWDWPRRFRDATLRHDIEVDTFDQHWRLWATAFTGEELEERRSRATARMELPLPVAESAVPPRALPTPTLVAPREPKLAPVTRKAAAPPASVPPAKGPVRLHVGCGPDRRTGWVNVDLNPDNAPDLVAAADRLDVLGDGTVEEIMANHLFEHLTLTQAEAALREWRRVLKPGGRIELELPDLEGCLNILGKFQADGGADLGLVGLFGWPKGIDAEGEVQLHKWAWSEETLSAALRAAGFDEVERVPLTQTQRLGSLAGRDMRLRAVARRPAARNDRIGACEPIDPWPLATDARFRLLAWPRYDAVELGILFREFGKVAARRFGVCLCLRWDSAVDGDQKTCLAALQSAAHVALQPEDDLEVLLVDDPDVDAVRLGRSVHWTVGLPSGDEVARRAFLAGLRVPCVVDGPSLAGVLDRFGARQRPAAPVSRPTAASRPVAPASPAVPPASLAAVAPRPPASLAPALVNPAPVASADPLQTRIDELHPWFYPVVLGGHHVEPGRGSDCDARFLASRIEHRSKLLVDGVASRVDLDGRSLLDLASNCGYWAARYAERGLARVVSVEGRERFCNQAELYWKTEGFLPARRRRFLVGNVLDASVWAELRRLGPYDLTLCAGLLYHLPDYRQLLAWVAAVTREAVIVDTRVGPEGEPQVLEPGELHFNAIEATRTKIVPHLPNLLAHLDSLDFTPEVLPAKFGNPYGLRDVDSYDEGNRVCIVAQRR